MLDVEKTVARVSASQHFAGTLSAIARDLGSVRSFCAPRTSVKTVRESVKPAVFINISFAIARVSAKGQEELAMCWRWDLVSKTYGSAIVMDARTETG